MTADDKTTLNIYNIKWNPSTVGSEVQGDSGKNCEKVKLVVVTIQTLTCFHMPLIQYYPCPDVKSTVHSIRCSSIHS